MTRERISIIILAVALIAVCVFGFIKMRQYDRVINAQGLVIKFMIETPQINSMLSQEYQRRQQNLGTTSTAE